MTTDRRLDSDLPRILGDIAAGPYPDYIDDVLSTTAQRRQRPTWTFPERWLPMDIATTQVPTARFPMRALSILALVALLIAGALIAYTGAQQNPAPPFGLAANGSIAYSSDGDIYTIDDLTGQPTLLIGGEAVDRDPVYSLDGLQMAFARRVEGADDLVVARADGSDPTVVTPEPLDRLSDVTFSPDGTKIAMVGLHDATPSLALVASDGSDFRWIDAGGVVRAPAFLPSGDAAVFVLETTRGEGEAVARLDLATEAIDILVPGAPTSEIPGRVGASPDGSRIVYAFWVPGPPETTSRIFTLGFAAGSEPVERPLPPGTCCEGFPVFSNDGSRMAINRWLDDGRKVVAIVQVGAAGPGTVINADISDTADLVWSPDDRYVLGWGPIGTDPQGVQFVIDVAAAERLPTTWLTGSHPAWQRVGTGS